jgi:two-component system, OmpR family, response regulator
MRILFIPCARPESLWLYKAFQESAHSLQRADDLPDGMVLATQEAFDAIVTMALDPAAYGQLLDALKPLATASGAPIIVVLGPTTPAQRARVLRAGADACFFQPYSFIELHERLQALHRTGRARAARAPHGLHGPHGLELDATTRELVAGDIRLDVTRREYLLLECLMRHFNAPVPRDQLIRYAWPEAEFVDPSSVNLVVSRLRRKLAQRASHVRIETVNRYGYQIVVDSDA